MATRHNSIFLIAEYVMTLGLKNDSYMMRCMFTTGFGEPQVQRGKSRDQDAHCVYMSPVFCSVEL